MEVNLYVVGIVAAAIPAWYVYQIATRKKQRVRYKLKKFIVAMAVYFPTVIILIKQGLPQIEALGLGVLAGLGAAWSLIKQPKETRRIPTAIRRAVIKRDLTDKGEKWNPAIHHIDHLVPFSKGGDNSLRNLRVIEKRKNLSKGAKMPGLRDFSK